MFISISNLTGYNEGLAFKTGRCKTERALQKLFGLSYINRGLLFSAKHDRGQFYLARSGKPEMFQGRRGHPTRAA